MRCYLGPEGTQTHNVAQPTPSASERLHTIHRTMQITASAAHCAALPSRSNAAICSSSCVSSISPTRTCTTLPRRSMR
jgi:hypothetical protein